MSSPSSSKPSDDGRERFGRNVAFAWGGYLVNVIAGFVIPRLISDQLGQATLGIWDFAWSFVGYFGLVQMGMGGSISRYVAHYRAKDDVTGLNRSVSTIAVFQRSVGWLCLLMAGACAWWIMPMFASKFGGETSTASWVILFIGAEVALTTSLAAYGAVMVGCHRWDLTNSVSAIAYVVSALGMVAVLLLGGGLPALALVHCLAMVGGELARWRLVKKVCPELRIKRELASWSVFLEQARYSGKTLIPWVAELFSNQVLSFMITGFIGPAGLAVFSRSRSLMTTFRTLGAKFGMILVPTASAMQAKSDREALRQTLLTKPAIISSLMLPVMIGLAVFGDLLIEVWMGKDYVKQGLLPILTISTYATLVQEPIWSVLSGMNCHGRIAIGKLIASVISAGLLLVGLWKFDWGLLGAAACFALPRLLVDGIVTPWLACRLLGVSKMRYLWKTNILPLICVSPFGAALLVSATMLAGNLVWMALLIGTGALVTWGIYLKWLISPQLKEKIGGLIRKVLPKRGVEGCP